MSPGPIFKPSRFPICSRSAMRMAMPSRDISFGTPPAIPVADISLCGGVDQPAGTVIDIGASDLAGTSFVTGAVGDSLQIRAFDGALWSAADNAVWSPFIVTVPANHAPAVTNANAI